jgi:hypothetical protein
MTKPSQEKRAVEDLESNITSLLGMHWKETGPMAVLIKNCGELYLTCVIINQEDGWSGI